MKKILLLMLPVLLFVFIERADADLLFSDNFDSENGGKEALNHTGFQNWSVTNGTVDLIGNGSHDYLPGHGLYVDMDGDSMAAGTMTSKNQFALTPGSYTLSFKLAGNQINNDSEKIDVSVGSGLFSKSFSLPQNAPFTSFDETFNVVSATNASISFQGFGGDNKGMLVDDVSLNTGKPISSVPEPATALLFLMGLTGLAAFRKKIQ